ncbi:MAG: thermonuclease family protein [Clostridiales Family XIII bacterium]|jgi:micrococcal nuclease|nr:thermonuclease family protein [Clostridiales Family XIII bacterium]
MAKQRKLAAALILILIAIAAAMLFAAYGGASGDTAAVRVLRVVDGDTIVVDLDGISEKVRLIGIDTPESVHPDASKNVPYGKVASDYTKSRLEGQSVTLEFDTTERDRYGRLLAYVYIGDEMFNKTLLEEGHASVSTYPPNVKYVEEFTAAQKAAREAGKGIWSAAGGIMQGLQLAVSPN